MPQTSPDKGVTEGTGVAGPGPAGAVPVGPGIARLTAPNPSVLTGGGTNTWLLGAARLVVIDPGPALPAHLAALLAAISGRPVTAIVVTHAHADHSGLAPALARATGAPVLARGDWRAGRSAVMEQAAVAGLSAAEDGLDRDFRPDICLGDGARVAAEGGDLGVLHTPGHAAGHICLTRGDSVFSGDHVMGWATSVISPPDGDMGDYMRSLGRLQDGRWRRALPGHGGVVADLPARLAALIAHRRAREAAVRAAIDDRPRDLGAITRAAYGDVAPALLDLASRSCLAHLIDLADRGLARSQDAADGQTAWRRA